MLKKRNIAVIGLGYVGLPLALSLAKKNKVIGYDINVNRINQLKNRSDLSLEVFPEDFNGTELDLVAEPDKLSEADFFIITVPTPVDNNKNPDLTCLFSASETVGKALKSGDIVVYESTVYPGCTENDCAYILEKFSGLTSGVDFKLGYSPERMNPGDKIHTIDNVVKIVSGQDEQALDEIAAVYNQVVKVGLYKAESIKIAEAAKVLENTQRDLNIALMNEVSRVFNALDIDTNKVIDAASTKWNFMKLRPGLVGGHCIGIDPYYLIHKAKQVGVKVDLLQSARNVNNDMGAYVANRTIDKLNYLNKNSDEKTIAILGLTFKENCSDLRNSRVTEIISLFKRENYKVIIHDPEASEDDASLLYGMNISKWEDVKDIDAMVITVAHNFYKELQPIDLLDKFKAKPLIMDVRAVLNVDDCKKNGIMIWQL